MVADTKGRGPHRTIRYAASALVAAGVILTAGAVRAQDVAPLDAYGALPAHEPVEVSPSGDRLACVTVVGEERALVIHDLDDMSLIGGVRAGPVKVRDIGWVGEDHVYVYSTATQVGGSISLRRSGLVAVLPSHHQVRSRTEKAVMPARSGLRVALQDPHVWRSPRLPIMSSDISGIDMTFLTAFAVAVAPVQAAPAADLAGVWEGRIGVGGQSIRIVFRVDAAGNAAMDSPDQGARNIAVDRPTVEGGMVRFVVPVIGGRFEGTRSDDGQTLTGALSQGGMTVPLILTRTAATATLAARPQTPVPPFPYRSEAAAFDNPAAPGVRLAGTLTLPEGAGPFPAAILITGTGLQDRDETIEGHKSFAIWADALTRRGVAVLRYDDRGVADSTGNFGAATQMDFASDVKAAFDWLSARPDIDRARIGLIGHSEGGTFAPMAMQNGAKAAWLVMLAGPAVSGGEIIQEQQRRIAVAAGMSPEEVERTNALQRLAVAAVSDNAGDPEAARRAVEALLLENGRSPQEAAQVAAVMASDWYRGMIVHDPADSIRTIRVPLLAVYGGKDVQVPADQNGPAIIRLKPDAEVVVLPGLNHLFQPAQTGLTAEYGQIETTLDPSVIQTVVDWVAARSGL